MTQQREDSAAHKTHGMVTRRDVAAQPSESATKDAFTQTKRESPSDGPQCALFFDGIGKKRKVQVVIAGDAEIIGRKRRRSDAPRGAGRQNQDNDDDDDDEEEYKETTEDESGSSRGSVVGPDASSCSEEEEESEEGSTEDASEGDPDMDDIMERYTNEELEYIHSDAGKEKYQQIKDMELAVRAMERRETPLRFHVLLSDVDLRIKSAVVRKLNSVADLEQGTGEYAKLMAYVNAMSRLPVGRYRSLQLVRDQSTSAHEVGEFLSRAHACMDAAIYGQKEVKKQFIMTMAKWVSNPASQGLVLGIESPPGCGKTSLVKEGLAKALGLPYAFIPLGGANDAAFLDGHGFTYEGSTYGKIAEALMTCGCMNPILCFDELDKVADNHRGTEIFNVLTHLTDYTQNDAFCDKYFADIPLDLSRSIMVFTYNDVHKIPPILKDRMVCLKYKPYTAADRTAIMETFMMPKILKAHGLCDGDITIDKDTMASMISLTRSEGMRELKRQLDCIVSNINMLRMLPEKMQREHLAALNLHHDRCISLPMHVDDYYARAFLKELKADYSHDNDILRHLYM